MLVWQLSLDETRAYWGDPLGKFASFVNGAEPFLELELIYEIPFIRGRKHTGRTELPRNWSIS